MPSGREPRGFPIVSFGSRLRNRLAAALLDRSHYRIVPRSPFAERLDELLRDSGFFFVQVGAHDGVRFDDLYQKVTAVNAHGIVIEPLPRYFRRLSINYEDYPGVVPLNLALHPSRDRVEIFHVDPARAGSLAPWTHGLGSVDPRHHERTATPRECMTSTTVEAMPLSSLLDRHGVTRIDLLQIDVEGFDREILGMVPFARVKPRLIKFEVAAMDDAARTESLALLARYGYRTHVEGEDGIGILPEWPGP